MRGFTGSKGNQGYNGSQGFRGYTGSQGERGERGGIGFRGFTGSIGPRGWSGIRGFTGSKGEAGEPGKPGEAGLAGGPTGPSGPAGPIGYTGSNGATGPQGETGATGPQGTQGELGFTGSQGDIGYTGSQGEVGFTGSKGDKGDVGPAGGPTGPIGFTGSVGFTGSAGFTGSVGFTGSIGLLGFTGSIGFTGSSGNSAYEVFINVKKYGAIGDNTDDTDAIQNALALSEGKTLFFPAGTYIVTSPLTIKSNTRILGEGLEKSIIKLSDEFDNSLSLVNNYTDSNSDIILENITFSGNNNPDRSIELISMNGVSNLDVLNCGFKDHTYIGIGIGGTNNVRITKSNFRNIGIPIPSTTSSPAIWCDVWNGITPTEVVIEQNYFAENNWSAAYFMPNGGSFSHNTCINNGESTVYTNENGRNIRYIGNYINGTRRSNISAAGLEIGGWYHVIANNIILNCAADGITVTDTKNTTIIGNNCYDNGRENTYARFALAAGIGLMSLTSCSGVVISNNRCYDTQTIKTQKFGIFVYKAPSASAISETLISNNNLFGNSDDTIRNHQDGSIDLITTIITNNIG